MNELMTTCRNSLLILVERLISLWYSLQTQAEQDKLTCYYYNKHPLLLLKPVKIEMASLKPDIYLLHDIIREADIEFITNLAAPRVSASLLCYAEFVCN